MKRMVILVVSFLLFASVFSEEVKIKDVSPLIDEYNAVKFVVENRIVPLRDGYFEGEKIVTKFDIAVYIYNLVKYFERLKVKEEMEKREKTLPIEELLRYDPKKKDFTRISSIEKKLDDLENDVRFLLEKFSKPATVITTESTPVLGDEIRATLKMLSDKVRSLSNDVDRIKKDLTKVETLESSLTMAEKSLKELQETIENFYKDSVKFKERINEIEKNLSVLKKTVTEISSVGITAKLEELGSRLSSIETRVNSNSKRLLDLTKSGYVTRAEFDKKLQEFKKTFHNELNTEITKVYARLNDLEMNLKNLPGASVEYIRLERELKDYESKLKEYNTYLILLGVGVLASFVLSLIVLFVK